MRKRSAFLTVGLALVALLGLALAANAGPRAETLAGLRAMESGAPADSVRVIVETGKPPGEPVRIGESLVYAFHSDTAGYLTAIHLDMHGAMTLLYPRMDPQAGRIGGGRSVKLPAADDPFELAAQPPVGRDLVYAIVTREPITRRDLGLASGEIVVSFEPHQAAGFVDRLKAVVDARSPGSVQVAHVVQEIEGHAHVQYRSAEIVEFFGTRTRSIRPPKLDLQIHFASDSATLDAKARRNIDEFARALEDPKLVGIRFKVAGHTDDTGGEAHNLTLSRRRAEAVRRYLVEEKGIDAARLAIEAHGENDLLIEEQTEYARRMNRRVEFSPAR